MVQTQVTQHTFYIFLGSPSKKDSNIKMEETHFLDPTIKKGVWEERRFFLKKI